MRVRRGLLAIAILAVVLGPAARANASIFGPDVSSYQHPQGYSINWTSAKVSGDVSFAFVKATEDVDYVNPYFARDFAALHASGLVRGAYHFAKPYSSMGSAISQARHFVAVAGRMGNSGDLPAVLDLEVNNGLPAATLIEWTRAYLNEIRALTGRNAIIYTGPYFWRRYMANTTTFNSHPLWVASYSSTVALFGGWSSYTFWQYTDHAALPGVPAKVDMSRFGGTFAQLRLLARASRAFIVPVLTARLSASLVRRGSPVTMSGAITPILAGARVYRQGFYSGGWHTWATTVVTRTGSYVFTIHATTPVNYYRVWVPGSLAHAAAASHTLTLRTV